MLSFDESRWLYDDIYSLHLTNWSVCWNNSQFNISIIASTNASHNLQHAIDLIFWVTVEWSIEIWSSSDFWLNSKIHFLDFMNLTWVFDTFHTVWKFCFSDFIYSSSGLQSASHFSRSIDVEVYRVAPSRAASRRFRTRISQKGLARTHLSRFPRRSGLGARRRTVSEVQSTQCGRRWRFP